MNFLDKYLNWIKLCITTAPFSINLNGVLTCQFKSSRGFRQGDPLSPSVFIIAMKGFIQLLKQKISDKTFHFYPKCQNIGLSSLVFADDLFQVIKESLEKFQQLSDLTPNKDKCEIFISGLNTQQ